VRCASLRALASAATLRAMQDPPSWDVVEHEQLQDCAVFRVMRSLSRSPRTGQLHPFYAIEADPWVNVVPLTASGEIVMIRQWRHGSRAVTLEIPGGIVDPGESPADAAVRELREETGFGGGRLEPLGSVNPNPALFGNRLHTFVARDVVRLGAAENHGLEETAVVLVPRGSLAGLLRSGAIDHALVVAGLCRFLLAEGL
jgi:8-oxo-dGTP pyrophosphatase MutT (NUDIX family)